ncbi:MAG: hypothetical protein L0I24_24500 [Pseudonocardia sp.]|nr:hypothetical protein [Pseudonocardia sp.]
MSAFTVNAAHIDAIVNASRAFGGGELIDQRAADLIGTMLWDENYRSVNYRYTESEPTPDYRAELVDADLSPVAVLKAIDCYEYQSCESPDWGQTRAHAYVTALRNVILGRHSDLAREVPSRYDRSQTEHAYKSTTEYGTAPWEVDDLAQVTVERHAGDVKTAIAADAVRGQGSVYQSVGRLDVTEIAKRMRVNLRNAQSVGMLPAEAKFSVTTDRYAGGQSVDVTVKGMPDSWTYTIRDTAYGKAERVHSDAARATTEAIRAMLAEYNRDNSDSMTDYYSVWFSPGVTVEDERTAAFWAGEKARKAVRKARRSA